MPQIGIVIWNPAIDVKEVPGLASVKPTDRMESVLRIREKSNGHKPLLIVRGISWKARCNLYDLSTIRRPDVRTPRTKG